VTLADVVCRRALRIHNCSVHIIEPGVFHTDMTSDENFTGMLTRAWEGTTQEVREEFGENYLQERMYYYYLQERMYYYY